jgi:hypothetical protein
LTLVLVDLLLVGVLVLTELLVSLIAHMDTILTELEWSYFMPRCHPSSGFFSRPPRPSCPSRWPFQLKGLSP